MAQDIKQDSKPGGAGRAAPSVDREPKDEPTPQGHGIPVDHEDGPKGQPTSDRFQTERAHQADEKDTGNP